MSFFDDIFSGVGKLANLAPVAATWKELIDPVRAVQQPTLGMGAGTPIVQPPPAGTISKTPGQTAAASPVVWYAVGGITIVLLFLVMSRKG